MIRQRSDENPKPRASGRAYQTVAVLYGGWGPERSECLTAYETVRAALEWHAHPFLAIDIGDPEDLCRITDTITGQPALLVLTEECPVQPILDYHGISYNGPNANVNLAFYDKRIAEVAWSGCRPPSWSRRAVAGWSIQVRVRLSVKTSAAVSLPVVVM